MHAEILARFSMKTVAWAALCLMAAGGIWTDTYLHGLQLLDGRRGALWPAAALGSLIMGFWAAWLLVRASFPGAAAIIKRREQFVCFLPWKIVINIQDVQRVQVSEYGSAVGLPRAIVSGPQVEVLLRNGKSIKIRTPLLKDSAEDIAARMTAALRPVPKA